MPGRMSSHEFFALLEKRRPADGASLDRLIERRCGEELAILMSDSSGFTRRTHEVGILPALASVRRLYALCTPLIERRGGTVVSQRADNLLAIFPEAADAVRAAVEIQQVMRKKRAEGLGLCLGVDVGRVIRLAEDVYGPAVNVASKLGEDLAGRDEILVTAAVAQRVRGKTRVVYSRSTEVGGKLIELYRVVVPRR
jgi:adenylate cyclase